MILATWLDTATTLWAAGLADPASLPISSPTIAPTAEVAPTPSDPISSLLAPGGALTLILGTVWFSAREFRKGREMRVKEAEDAEEQARNRQTAAEVDRDRVTGELRSKLSDVERQLIELREEMRRTLEEQENRHRGEMRAQEGRHRSELAEARAREEMTNSENWRLRTLLTRRGYDPDTGEPIRASTNDGEHGASELSTPPPVLPPGAVHRIELHDRGPVADGLGPGPVPVPGQDDDDMGV